MEVQNWKIFYETSRQACLEIINKFDKKFSKIMPKLHRKLSVEKVETKYFFIEHYYTLLMNSCPLFMSKNIISLFLVLG